MKNPSLVLIVVLLLPLGALLPGCERTHVEEPWASDQQFTAERERTAERAETLRQRIRMVQQDR